MVVPSGLFTSPRARSPREPTSALPALRVGRHHPGHRCLVWQSRPSFGVNVVSRGPLRQRALDSTDFRYPDDPPSSRGGAAPSLGAGSMATAGLRLELQTERAAGMTRNAVRMQEISVAIAYLPKDCSAGLSATSSEA